MLQSLKGKAQIHFPLERSIPPNSLSSSVIAIGTSIDPCTLRERLKP